MDAPCFWLYNIPYVIFGWEASPARFAASEARIPAKGHPWVMPPVLSGWDPCPIHPMEPMDSSGQPHIWLARSDINGQRGAV